MIMNERAKIVITKYDPEWAECFELLKSVFERHLGELILSVEHVGSTSIIGLAAKPIIDIDIVVERDENIIRRIITKLEELGYDHVGDLGIVGREVFKCGSNKTPFDGSNRDWNKHHLYVCIEGTVSLSNHVKLRDFLRKDEIAMREYEELKMELAEKFPFDIDAYIEGKTNFIVGILKRLDFSEIDLRQIVEQNKMN